MVAVGLALILGLAAFYYYRSTSNATYLTQRNLRQLARMARALESQVNGFDSVLRNLLHTPEGSEPPGVEQVKERADLVPNFELLRVTPPPPAGGPARQEPAMRVDLGGPFLAFSYAKEVAVEARSDLAALARPVLMSELFDHLFLAQQDGRVLLEAPESGLRLGELPGTAAKKEGEAPPAGRVSTAREVEVAGQSFRMFLQPVRLRLAPPGEEGAATEWVVGGLVDDQRFRNDSLALDSTELLALILLLVAIVLAWPFLKVWAMGPGERVEVRDVLFMGFSLVTAAGLVSLCLVDLGYYPALRRAVDRQLTGVSDRLAESFGREVDAALQELHALSVEYTTEASSSRRTDPTREERPDLRVDLLSGVKARSVKGRGSEDADTAAPSTRYRPGTFYPHLEMAFWADRQGDQRAKWTVRESLTPLISVAEREYFRRVVDDRLWTRERPSARGGREAVRYYLEPIRSQTTGELLTALSIPCPGKPGWAAVMITRPVSLDRPLLPPGFGFAVLAPDGRALYHIRPESSMEENFFDETAGDDLLRAVVAARVRDHMDARYLGRDYRLFVSPLAGTPFTLVVFADKEFPRTINFETILVAWLLFMAFILVQLVLFAGLYWLRPASRFSWAWPDREHRFKYPLLIVVLSIFAAELLRHAVAYAPKLLLPGVFLIPVQAMGLGLVVLTCGLRPWDRRRRLGWGLLAGATGLQVVAGLALRYGSYGIGVFVGPVVVALIAGALVYVCDRTLSWVPGKPPTTGKLYMGTILFTTVVLGMLPASLFFRATYFDQLKLLVKVGQLRVVDGMEQRALRNADRAARAGDTGGGWLGPPGAPLDMAVDPFFHTCVEEGGGPWICGAASEPDLAGLHPSRGGTEVLATIGDYLPLYTQVSVATRKLSGTGASDAAWRWRVTEAKDLLLETGPDFNSPSYRVFSVVPTGLARPGGLLWWLGAVVAFGVLVVLVRFMSCKVFLLDFDPPPGVPLERLLPAGVSPAGERLLAVYPPLGDPDSLLARRDLWPVDLERERLRGAPAPVPAAEDKPVVCVQSFSPALDDPDWSRRLVEWLEGLAADRRRGIVLLSCRAAELELTPPAVTEEGQDAPGGERGLRELHERWVRLLGSFHRVEARIPSDPETLRRVLAERQAAALDAASHRPMAVRRRLAHLFRLLGEECIEAPALQEVGLRLLEEPGFVDLMPDALVDLVRERADGHYRLLWESFSPDAQLVVSQLAYGAVVNPRQRRALGRLLAQGILVRRPELRLMNRSLARFVIDTVSSEEITQRQGEGAVSTWQRVRRPLLLALAVVAVFLFTTQRDLFNSTLALVSALTVGLPGLFKLLGLLRQAQGNGGPGG